MISIPRREFGPDVDGRINALFHGDEEDQADARRALLELGSSAVDRLIAVLLGQLRITEDPLLTPQGNAVRRCHEETVAAGLLGEIGDRRAVPALIEVLNHNYSQYDLVFVVGPDALEALQRITGKDLGMNQKAWREWWSATSGTA
jgi:HEAT repeat protein